MSDEVNADGNEPGGNAAVRLLQRVVPDVIRKRFALKFALVLVLLGVILAAVGFTATGALSDQVEDNVQDEYEELATQQATIAEEWIQRNSVSVRLASQNRGLTEDPTQAGDTVTTLWGTLAGDVDEVHLVSFDGQEPQIIANSSSGTGEGTPAPIADTPQSWVADSGIENADSSVVRMSDTYRKDGDMVIAFVSQVERSPSRYLVVEYYADQLGDSLENDTRSNHFAQIINADGVVQVDSRMTEGDGESATVLSEYGNNDTVAQAMGRTDGTDAQQPGVRIIEDDPSVVGEDYAVGYASVDVGGIDKELALVTHAPTSELFAFVNTVTTWGQIVVMIGVLLVGLVGASLGYSTANALDRLRGKVEEMEAGNLDVAIHSTRIDSIGRLYGGFASMRDALRTQINEAEQARKEAEVARAEAMEMNEYLQGKAEEYSAIMGECSSGDLTQRMDVAGENDAMDQIATDFNEMIGELEKTVGQLKHFADEVEEAGDDVETSAESVRDASEQVAESIQRISDDAYDQQERLERLSESIGEAIDQFERVAADADIDISESVEQLRAVAETINDLVDLTDGMMAESENVAGAAEEQAAELNAVSQQARDLTRYARPLRDVLESFETEEEHEFYFPTGPGSPQADDS